MNTPTAIKVWLLQFFTGSRDPEEGHSWVLISKWQQPEEHRALQNHPLYGIKGWAVVFLCWLIISSAFSLFITYSYWNSLKILNWRAFDQLSGNYEFDMAVAWILFGWSCMTAYWLWKKDEMFRMSFFYLTLSAIILSVISSQAMGGESAAVGLLVSFFKSFIFLIPMAYVFRSKRISVTCDDLLRHDDSFLAKLKKRETNLRTKSTPNRQRRTPITTANKSAPNPVEVRDIDQVSETELDNSELEFYEQAWKEVNSENPRDEGIWGKAYVETDGDEQKTTVLYIKLRVLQLKKDREEEERRAEAERLARDNRGAPLDFS